MKQAAKATIFDVGHGSCVFLQDGSVTTVIDCKHSTLLIEFLLSRNITSITQIIISHADADHIDGILALIQSDYIKLGTVFLNPDAKESETWTELRIALQDAFVRRKLNVQTDVGEGMSDRLQTETVTIEIVAPGIAARLGTSSGLTTQGKRLTSNSMSVVLRLHHNGHPVMLIAGDLDNVGLSDLIIRRKELRGDILLFPHHGGHIAHGRPADRVRNNAAFTKALINHVKPQLVLFSIGRGVFSTPRPEIINEIRATVSGPQIHCTQLSEHCHSRTLGKVPMMPSALPAAGRSENKSCGGSLEIVFDGKDTMKNLDRTDHLRFIAERVSTPLCRSKP